MSSSKRYLMVGLGVVAVAAALFLPFWYGLSNASRCSDEYLSLSTAGGPLENQILRMILTRASCREKAGRYLNPIFWS